MSVPEKELIERLRRAYELFSAEDFDAAMEFAHPDIVFARPGGQSDVRGAGSGIEMELEAWTLWTFDQDGRATRAEFFLPHQEDEARRALRGE